MKTFHICTKYKNRIESPVKISNVAITIRISKLDYKAWWILSSKKTVEMEKRTAKTEQEREITTKIYKR